MLTTKVTVDLAGVSDPPDITQVAMLDLWCVRQTVGVSDVTIVGTLDELTVWVDYVSEIIKESRRP